MLGYNPDHLSKWSHPCKKVLELVSNAQQNDLFIGLLKKGANLFEVTNSSSDRVIHTITSRFMRSYLLTQAYRELRERSWDEVSGTQAAQFFRESAAIREVKDVLESYTTKMDEWIDRQSGLFSFFWLFIQGPLAYRQQRNNNNAWWACYSEFYKLLEKQPEQGFAQQLTVLKNTVRSANLPISAELEQAIDQLEAKREEMDETYVRVKGKWFYLYRAVDKSGGTIDFMLSKSRGELSAKRFFNKAIGYSGKPEKITIDKSGANNAALKSINKKLSEEDKIEIRQIKYLNNTVESDHRFIKRITKPMTGFKAVHSANATLLGIELHHMLRKGQHKNAANMTVFEQFYSLAV